MEQSSRRRILAIVGMLFAAAVLIAGALIFQRNKKDTEASRTAFSMGSAVSVKLYGPHAAAGAEAAEEEIRRLDEEVISWRIEASELARWNRSAKAGEGVSVSETLGRAVEQSLELGERSEGALDITLRPVLTLWGIEDASEEQFQVPTDADLKHAAERADRKGISVTRAGKEEQGALLTRSDGETVLDLGAVGKGYALDAAYDRLQSDFASSVSGGVIAVGGSVMVFGTRENGEGFKVGIRDPEGLPEDVLGVITFPAGTKKQCISTSGGYEKYIEKDGVRYHHIIDPATLHPAESGLVSVTVVCENGLISDGLSTACYILGEEKAKKLLSLYGAEAVLIRTDGSICITAGLEGRVEVRGEIRNTKDEEG